MFLMYVSVVFATVVPDDMGPHGAHEDHPPRSLTPPTPPVQAEHCLVIGHNKYKGVQRVYCNPFPAKQFHGSHRLDLVMIRPPGIDNGAFVVSPDSVWYARVLLVFSASAMTDTGSKSFECAIVSTLETYYDPENGKDDYYTHYSK
jgi:hypothetical protein